MSGCKTLAAATLFANTSSSGFDTDETRDTINTFERLICGIGYSFDVNFIRREVQGYTSIDLRGLFPCNQLPLRSPTDDFVPRFGYISDAVVWEFILEYILVVSFENDREGFDRIVTDLAEIETSFRVHNGTVADEDIASCQNWDFGQACDAEATGVLLL